MCSENELGKPLGIVQWLNLSTIGAMHKFKCPTIYLEEFLRIAPDDRDMMGYDNMISKIWGSLHSLSNQADKWMMIFKHQEVHHLIMARLD